MAEKKIIRYLLQHVLAIGFVSMLFILIAVSVIPHLPLSTPDTFAMLLRVQMTLDHDREVRSQAAQYHHLLFMGSSVVERNVDDMFFDSLLYKNRLHYFSTNSGAGGTFANTNLLLLRTLLENGLHPDRIVYGTFLEEFNKKFLLHVTSPDSGIRLRKKSLWNDILYGPSSIVSFLEPTNFHIYIFSVKHAFRTVQDPNLLERLSFGENMYERDSSYEFSSGYLNDLKAIYAICKERHIPFALFNSPVRPTIESLADLPYNHKKEAYQAIENFAIQERIPIWNFDNGKFSDEDFLDTYHLNAIGTHKMTNFLFEKVGLWMNGITEQDIVGDSSDSVCREIKDSLVRTAFHF